MSLRDEEPHNPKYVTTETCRANRAGDLSTLTAKLEIVEEKIKSFKSQLVIGFTVSTLIIVVVQFLLSFR